MQCSLVDNLYQQKSEALFTFTQNKSYTYNTEFDEIIITFTDENSKLIEIEGRVNLTLLIDK